MPKKRNANIPELMESLNRDRDALHAELEKLNETIAFLSDRFGSKEINITSAKKIKGKNKKGKANRATSEETKRKIS